MISFTNVYTCDFIILNKFGSTTIICTLFLNLILQYIPPIMYNGQTYHFVLLIVSQSRNIHLVLPFQEMRTSAVIISTTRQCRCSVTISTLIMERYVSFLFLFQTNLSLYFSSNYHLSIIDVKFRSGSTLTIYKYIVATVFTDQK